jgi:TctA family transporter
MGELMLTSAFDALQIIVDPLRFSMMMAGVLIGLVLGVIPGLGGLVGLSLLLPFTFDMDPYTALAMMMGLSAVTVTSDAIPAILFGVPGTVASAATVVDGFPMARKGEAGRAFGAAFSASVMGGLFGALLLALCIPILRPLMLSVGSPEMLSFCLFGLSLAAVLSGGAPLKGLAAVCIGLLVATTGDDPQTGTLRWTFDTLYLWDGFPIVPIALGLFAIPELADMAIARTSIADTGTRTTGRSQIEGIKDTFKHWFLILRCSVIGAGLGAVPGIGASVIDWIAYGHAARTEKGAALTFGTGDVRGVIASESSNNAKEGGALVPTIAFGVPGSASMALILGAFLIHGITPGPDMLSKRLDVTYTLVWSVALANVVGAGICFVFANQLAKIALVRIGILAPVVLAVTYVGAYQGSTAWGDIYALLAFGAFGWVMKRLRWPRPPLILGFVLGELVERYLFISVERYGWEWLFHPIVFVMLLITLYGVAGPMIRNYLRRDRARRTHYVLAWKPQGLNVDTAFSIVILAAFIAAIVVASGWEFGARLMPLVIAWGAIIFLVLQLCSILFVTRVRETAGAAAGGSAAAEPETAMHFDITVDFKGLEGREIFRRGMRYFGWCLFFLAAAATIGFLPGMLLFLVGYMRFEGRESWKTTLIIASATWIFSYGLFHLFLHIPWPQTVVGDLFPGLRSMQEFALF